VLTKKVRMVLDLPAQADQLFKAIGPKLRAQVRRPEKAGCTVKDGGVELLDDFYRVFLVNMRLLGSPVHHYRFLRSIVTGFDDRCRVFVVYGKEGVPLACSITLFHQGLCVNPWASSDRRYQKIAPNMMLYWRMLEHAVERGCTAFDFGRSTVGEGTYRFKKQWGAHPQTLHWYRTPDASREGEEPDSSRKKELFIAAWQKMPLCLTRCIGPLLRRQISL